MIFSRQTEILHVKMPVRFSTKLSREKQSCRYAGVDDGSWRSRDEAQVHGVVADLGGQYSHGSRYRPSCSELHPLHVYIAAYQTLPV